MSGDARPTPMFIGLAGPTGSGKTTVARRLVEMLGAERTAVLPVDAYYKDLSEIPRTERDAWNFDSPEAIDADLLRRHLALLGRGEEIERPVYRFETHTRAPGGEPFRPRETLILEGLFSLYWSDIRTLLDLGVYLRADEATCLDRRLRRDIHERGRSEEMVRRQFEQTVLPMQTSHVLPTERHADLVLDGRNPVDDSAGAILSEWRKVTRREEVEA